jgi:hypothetical protein
MVAESGYPITLISRFEPAAAEATTSHQQKGLCFSTLREEQSSAKLNTGLRSSHYW